MPAKIDTLTPGRLYRIAAGDGGWVESKPLVGEFIAIETIEKKGRRVWDEPRKIRKARFKVVGRFSDARSASGPIKVMTEGSYSGIYDALAGQEVSLTARYIDFDTVIDSIEDWNHTADYVQRMAARKRRVAVEAALPDALLLREIEGLLDDDVPFAVRNILYAHTHRLDAIARTDEEVADALVRRSYGDTLPIRDVVRIVRAIKEAK